MYIVDDITLVVLFYEFVAGRGI